MRDSITWTGLLVDLGVRPGTAVRWAEAFAKHVTPQAFSLGERELDDFVAQAVHEAGHLDHVTENLRYSAQRLMAVWPKRFPTLESALPYAMNGPALAEKVYQGRMGNAQPGDGFKYRGRGIPMITGRANYAEMAKITGLPLLESPDLLEQPDTALRVGVLWWENNVPDTIVDNVELVTRQVNGGVVGLLERKKLAIAAFEALKNTRGA